MPRRLATSISAPGRRPPPARRRRRAVRAGVVAIGLGLLSFFAAAARPASAQELGVVDVIEVSGLVDPIVADFVVDAIDAAGRGGSTALVLQINSGGGVLSDSELRDLVRAVSEATVPVAAWVGPAGSRARGQAHEIWSAAPVRATAPRAAVDERVAGSFESPTLGDFIVDLDGREVDGTALETARVVRAGGEPRMEPTVAVRFAKLGLVPRLLHTVASPSLAYLLLMIGLLLIVFEFFTAGVGIAAATGAVCAALAASGLATLPTRPGSVALLLVAVFAVSIDVQAGAPRVWSAVGAACFLAGSVRLYDGLSISLVTLAVVVAGFVLFAAAGMPAMIRTRFSTPTIGRESMIGEVGTATAAVDPEGVVEVRGAPWRARTNRATPVAAGDRVRIVAIDGLLLEVEPESGGARDYRR